MIKYSQITPLFKQIYFIIYSNFPHCYFGTFPSLLEEYLKTVHRGLSINSRVFFIRATEFSIKLWPTPIDKWKFCSQDTFRCDTSEVQLSLKLKFSNFNTFRFFFHTVQHLWELRYPLVNIFPDERRRYLSLLTEQRVSNLLENSSNKRLLPLYKITNVSVYFITDFLAETRHLGKQKCM